jgi:purine-binding chemotaxis protein CheW
MSSQEDFFDQDDEDALANKYLLATLGKETYGIDISFVTDILEMQKITEVPDMPDYVRGVINLRGQVIPAMDLRLKFSMPFRDYDDRTCIIIVNVGDNSIGFIVDTVSEVIEIPEADIDPPPEYQAAGEKGAKKRQFISGLGKSEDSVKLLLDVAGLVALESELAE